MSSIMSSILSITTTKKRQFRNFVIHNLSDSHEIWPSVMISLKIMNDINGIINNIIKDIFTVRYEVAKVMLLQASVCPQGLRGCIPAFLASATKLQRLCFYRHLSVHRDGGGGVSQHALQKVSTHALQQVSRGGCIPACIAGGIHACLAAGL